MSEYYYLKEGDKWRTRYKVGFVHHFGKLIRYVKLNLRGLWPRKEKHEIDI